jgi:hypothetical protein
MRCAVVIWMQCLIVFYSVTLWGCTAVRTAINTPVQRICVRIRKSYWRKLNSSALQKEPWRLAHGQHILVFRHSGTSGDNSLTYSDEVENDWSLPPFLHEYSRGDTRLSPGITLPKVFWRNKCHWRWRNWIFRSAVSNNPSNFKAFDEREYLRTSWCVNWYERAMPCSEGSRSRENRPGALM